MVNDHGQCFCGDRGNITCHQLQTERNTSGKSDHSQLAMTKQTAEVNRLNLQLSMVYICNYILLSLTTATI